MTMHNIIYIVIKEYINEYLNVERKLELDLIICFFPNPSLDPSSTDFAHRSAIAELFRDGGEVALSLRLETKLLK